MTRCACVVRFCPNTSYGVSSDIKFYRLPTAPLNRYQQWLKLIGRLDLLDKPGFNNYICEVHFRPSAFDMQRSKKLLRKNVLPSLFLPPLADEPLGQPPEDRGEGATGAKGMSIPGPCQPTQIDKPKKVETIASVKRKMMAKRLNHRVAFYALCDKFLMPEIAEMLKTQADIQFKLVKDKRSNDYTLFCMYLYHTSPPTYMSLQNHLKLPSVQQLSALVAKNYREGFPKFTKLLKIKIDCMTELEKNCVAIVSAVKLKPHLFYNIKDDKLVGNCKLAGDYTSEVARYGVILMVRGLYKQWTLPIDYALFDTKEKFEKEKLSSWVNGLLCELTQSGLKVRVLLSNLRSSAITVEMGSCPTIEKPFVQIRDNHIYYAYDPRYLMKSVYHYLFDHDFHFQGSVAKWQDILQFYNNDSKKELRLVPELTEKHVKPNDDDIEANLAIETLSERVAAGIANYVEFGLMDESAMGTVKLLALLGRLYKLMSSTTKAHNSCEYKKPFTGSEIQTNFVIEALTLFRHLKITKNGVDITPDVKFIKQFQMTIRVTMLLFEDLTLVNIPYLNTNNIKMSIFENFVNKIIQKSKTKDITAWRLTSSFNKMLFRNMMKLPKKKSCPQVVTEIFQNYLTNKESYVDAKTTTPFKVSNISLPVKMSDYKDFKWPATGQTRQVCEFLLKKCYERHNQCSLPQKIPLEPNLTRVKSEFLGDIFCVREENIVNFVEMLDDQVEKAFESYMRNNQQFLLALKPHMLPPNLVAQFEKPCPCFPIVFMIKLFNRLRISYQLMVNNKRFRKCDEGEITFIYERLK